MVNQTGTEYTIDLPDIVRAEYLTLVLSEAMSLKDILYSDDATGLKSFRPLHLESDGVEVHLPLVLSAGVNQLRFTGMVFEGNSITLLGSNLYAIEDVRFSGTNPDNGIRSGVVDGVPGPNTIEFRSTGTTEYLVHVNGVLTVAGHEGEQCVCVPDFDSRTETSVVINCDDNCKLYWKVEPYVS